MPCGTFSFTAQISKVLINNNLTFGTSLYGSLDNFSIICCAHQCSIFSVSKVYRAADTESGSKVVTASLFVSGCPEDV